MVAPLLTDRRAVTMTVRRLVTEGATLYVQGNLQASMDAYRRANELVDQTGSIFDRLWIDINSVDTQARSGKFDAAREILQRLIPIAHDHQFKWLEAKALSIYGSTPRLTGTLSELMGLLTQADRLFGSIGASYDRVRPLYYLAGYHYSAGDQDEALRLALECLQLADEGDVVRMSSFDFLIGSILYRQGLPKTAVLFQRESFEQTQKTKKSRTASHRIFSLGPSLSITQ